MTSSTKHFLPLEANPEVFTDLIHALGAQKGLSFVDVLSLDDPELLQFVPRPVLALILVFPDQQYGNQWAEEDALNEGYNGTGLEDGVMWFKQTIHNACGLYAILHALANGRGRSFVDPNSDLGQLLDKCTILTPTLRAQALEDSPELETAHTAAAVRGDTAPPDNAEAEVDFHYVCIVNSAHDNRLLWMDGDRKGPVPVDLTLSESEDMLCDRVLQLLRAFIAKASTDNVNFTLMALVAPGGGAR